MDTYTRLITFFEQFWHLYAMLPTERQTTDIGLCDSDEYRDIVSSQLFVSSCDALGMPDPTPLTLGNPDISVRSISNIDTLLTPEQLAAANTLLDLRDNRSQKKKLQDLNISTTKFEAWLRDTNFQTYIRTKAENMLGDNQHEAHAALLDKVRAGDMKAIQYYNEVTGRYRPVSLNAGQTVDVRAVLIRMLEVLQKHLSDQPMLLAVIADELSTVASPAIATTNSYSVPTVVEKLDGTMVIENSNSSSSSRVRSDSI